jgi:hypothetical protein
VQEKRTALSDQPIDAVSGDALKSNRYASALANFIQFSDTPLTIGIQGGWGTGKTSLLNLLAQHFKDSRRCLVVPVNAWEHSLFSSAVSAEVAVSLLRGLVDELQTAILDDSNIPQKHKDELQKRGNRLQELVKKVGTAALGITVLAGKAALKTVGMELPDGSGRSPEPDGPSAARQVRLLRRELEGCISYLTQDHGIFRCVVFFVDDLDRVNPQTAVEILDILKNIFDVRNSVFVLAIDYDVVVKGLRSRFGERGTDNEREFRQYFDKIIQVPFLMPVSSYRASFDDYMTRLFSGLSLHDVGHMEEMTNVAWRTTLGVPRSVKRIMNTMSLLRLLEGDTDGEGATSDNERLPSLFKLVCLQIGFPDIYKRVEESPEVRSWSVENLAKKWNLPLELVDRTQLKEEFPEEWKQVVALLAMNDRWLKARSHDVIEILASLLSDLEENGLDKDGNQLGELLSSVSVTSVGEGTIASESNSVKSDEVTQYCRKLHLSFVEARIAPSVDTSTLYAKQTGGRNYSFSMGEGVLGVGRIRLVRQERQWHLYLGVSVMEPKNAKRRFKEHMNGVARGDVVSDVEYPMFIHEFTEAPNFFDPAMLAPATEAFRKLVQRVRGRADAFRI